MRAIIFIYSLLFLQDLSTYYANILSTRQGPVSGFCFVQPGRKVRPDSGPQTVQIFQLHFNAAWSASACPPGTASTPSGPDKSYTRGLFFLRPQGSKPVSWIPEMIPCPAFHLAPPVLSRVFQGFLSAASRVKGVAKCGSLFCCLRP